MNKLLLILSLYLCTHAGIAQRLSWQFDVTLPPTNVRLDTPYQMTVQTVDIPENGYVVAKLEGECKSTWGDRIVFAVSDNKWWSSNFGNVGVNVIDSNFINNFSHTMVYKVNKGQYTFYALAHNFVDRDGSGVASVVGRMILEFIPDQNGKALVNINNMIHYPLILNTNELLIDSLTISMQKAGGAYVTLNGTVASLADQELIFNLKVDDLNSPKISDIGFYTVSQLKSLNFSLNRYLEFSAGTHKVYITAQKLGGNFGSDYNGLISTFSSQIFYNDDHDAKINSVTKETTISNYNQPVILGSLEIPILAKGKIQIAYSGETEIRSGEELDLEAKLDGVVPSNAIRTKNVMTHDKDKVVYFSRNEIIDVTPGIIKIDLEGIMKGNNPMQGTRNVDANLTVKFISETTTASEDIKESNSGSWSIYPNPFYENIQLGSDLQMSEPCSVHIINPLGQEIYKSNTSIAPKLMIDTRSWPAGIYTVSIKSKYQLMNKKLIKI